MKHIIFILLYLPISTNGQKIKYLPEPFFAPISFEKQEDRNKFAINSGQEKKGERWLIAGDRDKITILDKPNGKPSGQFLKFKETAFVIDESKEWIKIGIGSSRDNKFRNLVKSGWVKKTDVLLWPKCLRDKESFIPIKAIIVQNLSDMVSKTERSIKIYDGPTSSYILDDTDALKIFFIYKEEAHRVLIGTTDFLSSPTVRDVLVGWVDTAYIQRWNSRLALECNWEEPSYGTRRNDPYKRVYGFANQVSADLYSKNGSFIQEKVLWDNDPAKSDFPKRLRAEENPNRAVGEVFRFPVFDMTSGYIKSAGLVKIENDKMETEPIKSFVERNLSEATQTKIRQEKPRVVVDMYLPILIPGVEKPYKYIILMSEAELEEYVSQLRDLKRAMNAPEDVIREQLYNTVVSIILKMSGDTRTRKQIDNMDFAEFMAWVASMKREGIPIDLKGISIKDILDKKKLPSDELNNWAATLSDKEENLTSIARQSGNYPYSFTVGAAVHFWLDIDDLNWSESIK